MVNLSVFDHLGPFWAHLDPFGPFQTKIDFLLRSTFAKPYFVLLSGDNHGYKILQTGFISFYEKAHSLNTEFFLVDCGIVVI